MSDKILSDEITLLRDEIVEKAKAYHAQAEAHEKSLAEQLKIIETKGRRDEEMAAELTAQAEKLADQKNIVEALRTHYDELRRDIDRRSVADPGWAASDLTRRIMADEKLQSFVQRGWHKGNVVVNMPGFFPTPGRMVTTITSGDVGSATSGIIRPARVVPYIGAAERSLTLREILPSRPVSTNAVEYPKENSFTNAASPQVEAEAKSESALTFTIATANVRTIAHWVPATSQVLDDWPQLGRIIENKMLYGLLLKEEEQILAGDGTEQNLNGLITQATAFETTRINSGDNQIDYLRHGLAQLDAADEEGADFLVVHPSNFWAMVGLKDGASNTGAYLSGSPFAFSAPQTLYGRVLVRTNSITADTFLVGNSNQCEVFDRQQASVAISTEHSDYFIKNLVAIRVEERIALAVYRPAAFVTGSLSTASP